MNNDGATTASVIQSDLMSRGFQLHDFHAGLLDDCYRRQTRLSSRPDFDAVSRITGSLAPAAADRGLWAVIVETRCHPNMEFVVRNMWRQLGVCIQLFHGPTNTALVTGALADLIRKGVVRTTDLGFDVLPSQAYNALLLTPEFWLAIPSDDKVLVFQTDSIVCANRHYELDAFASLDLVGANWNPQRPVGFTINGGSGGFSLRNKQLALQCLERFPPINWVGGEDGYFGFHMELVGGNVASPMESARFATQNEFRFHSLGAHKIARLSPVQRDSFLSYCPEASRLIPGQSLDSPGAENPA